MAPQFFPVAFAGGEKLLSKVSCLYTLPSPLATGRDTAFAEAFVICAFGSVRLLVSSATSLGYMRQKEHSGPTLLCRSLGAKVRSWSAFSLPF